MIEAVKNEGKKLIEMSGKFKSISTNKTGVEIEALTGCSVAALTLYDMCKAISQDMVIENTRLVLKTGGKSDIKKWKSP